MSDDAVHAALRSHAPLVVVEAPAGCGKTHQGADFARDLAQGNDASRPLILTHTHAACSVFAERTKGTPARVDIRTIDSVVAQIASAYHVGLGLPRDTAIWVRERKNGHAELCMKVANLLDRHPMIARSLALRHRTVICDEHQDSSADQHAMVMALLDQGVRLRIFADPMQKIFKNTSLKGSHPPWEWDQLKGAAHEFVELEFPHRWKDGCPRLGEWTLNARKLLKSGGRIDLGSGVPDSVTVVFADNEARRTFDFQLSKTDRKAVDTFEQKQPSLLILTRHNDTARSFCAFFNTTLLSSKCRTRRSKRSYLYKS